MLLVGTIYGTALKYVSKLTRYGLKVTKKKEVKMTLKTTNLNQPSTSYVMATWAVFAIGALSYLLGLFNAEMALNEKGFYVTVFILGLFASITLQKTVRDRDEGLPVTNMFMGVCWFAFGSAIALLCIGLFNAELELSEKGFFGISFLMSLFAIITVQKNVRDLTDENGEVSSRAFPKASDDLLDVTEDVL